MRFCLCSLALLLTLSPRLLAADPPSTTASKPKPADADFAQGEFTLQLYGNYMQDLSNRDVKVGGAVFGFGYYLFDHVSLNLELFGGAVQTSENDAGLAGFGVMLRQHLYVDNRFSFYIDVGGGGAFAGTDVPKGGTHDNIWLRTGPGITYKLDDHTHLMTGIRYFHLSNASMDGPDRNPSSNGAELYLGMMFTF